MGYVAGATLASGIYITWFVLDSKSDPNLAQTGLGFELGFALFFWFAEGFALALFLMIGPWSLAVSAYCRFRRFGQFYFPAVGGFALFAIACATASVSPKPLLVEDQTFLEGARIAAGRQGLCFILAGIAFGISYWFFGERKVLAREKPDLS